jgi:hypothetical protein
MIEVTFLCQKKRYGKSGTDWAPVRKERYGKSGTEGAVRKERYGTSPNPTKVVEHFFLFVDRVAFDSTASA